MAQVNMNVNSYALNTIFDDAGGCLVELRFTGLAGELPRTLYFFYGAKSGFGGDVHPTGDVTYNVTDRDTFYTLYRMAQTEKPLQASWIVQDGTTKVTSVTLSTKEAAIGRIT
jgi:hypothetical protein